MDVTNKTKVPLFAVLVSLPVLVSAIIWLTNIDAKASGAQDELKGMRSIVQEILVRVIRIEEQIKHKE